MTRVLYERWERRQEGWRRCIAGNGWEIATWSYWKPKARERTRTQPFVCHSCEPGRFRSSGACYRLVRRNCRSPNLAYRIRNGSSAGTGGRLRRKTSRAACYTLGQYSPSCLSLGAAPCTPRFPTGRRLCAPRALWASYCSTVLGEPQYPKQTIRVLHVAKFE